MKASDYRSENGTQGRNSPACGGCRLWRYVMMNVLRGVDPYLDKEAVRVIMSYARNGFSGQNGKSSVGEIWADNQLCLDYNKCVCYENGETTSAFRLAGAADSAVCLPKQARKDGQTDTHTSGVIAIAADESFQPIVQEEVDA